MVYKLRMRLEIEHPLRRFTGEHPSTAGKLGIEFTPQGLVTDHYVEASPRLREQYRKVFREEGAPKGLSPVRAFENGGEGSHYVHGPCPTDAACAPCSVIRDLHQRLQEEIGGPAVPREVAFEDGHAEGHVRYLGDEPPEATNRARNGRQTRSVDGACRGIEGRSREHVEAALTSDELDELMVETLDVARDLGYFETPRRSTMEDLAEELGISKSAVCHRLKKLQRTAMDRLWASRLR